MARGWPGNLWVVRHGSWFKIRRTIFTHILMGILRIGRPLFTDLSQRFWQRHMVISDEPEAVDFHTCLLAGTNQLLKVSFWHTLHLVPHAHLMIRACQRWRWGNARSLPFVQFNKHGAALNILDMSHPVANLNGRMKGEERSLPVKKIIHFFYTSECEDRATGWWATKYLW